MSNLTTFGSGINKSFFEPDGKLHFAGTARPTKLNIMHTSDCQASHQRPLSFTSLAASNGITASGLDSALSSDRVVEIVGIDGGVVTKGVNNGSYTQKDTTHVSKTIMIRLTTMYGASAWAQAGEWKLALDIAIGDITGVFTVFMPAFSLEQYSTIEMFVTIDGATYYDQSSMGFNTSLAGPSAAEELFLNNESSGTDVVVEVTSTTGLYAGNQIIVSDSANSEWTRIKSLITDTSVTVDLANSYTTANGAKFEQISYIKTPVVSPIKRGLFKTFVFEPEVNQGITVQRAISQELDQTSNLLVVIQYIPEIDNPTALVSKWRVQYCINGRDDDMSESDQYGNLVYVDVVPPVTKAMPVALLCVIPYAASFVDKFVIGLELVRLGEDSGDTYTGTIRTAGIVLEETWDKLGYEP